MPLAHLTLCAVIVAWDIALAGRIAQLREAPRAFAAITGLCALLLLPAVLLCLATATVVTDRAVSMVDWIWPLVLVLFAVQAVYALARGLVNVAWGIPIAAYDILIAIAGVVRYFVAHGDASPAPLATLLAAQSTTIAVLTSATPAASPFYFNVPMVAPAFPALRRVTASFRLVMAVVAISWTVAIFTIGMDGAIKATESYRRHATDQIHERPNADFSVGLKILPEVSGSPPATAARNDIALFDTLDANAIAVVVVPGATPQALDSVSRVLDRIRRDSVLVIVALGYRGALLPEPRDVPLDEALRVTTIQRIERRLHPEILLPAEDPYGVGARVVGRLPVGRWEQVLSDGARAAKAIDPHVRIGVSVSQFGQSDSALYDWAVRPGSPVDVVGFSLFPEKKGLADLDETFERAADRWMAELPTNKDLWVFGTGGFPLNYGELSQERAIWQVLSWATGHAAIKGVIVYESADYGQARGLRAANGRLRPAAMAIMRAIRELQQSAAGI